MNPNGGVLARSAPIKNIFGVEREAIPHPRRVAAAPTHPNEKARQKERIGEEEEDVVESLLHQNFLLRDRKKKSSPNITSRSAEMPETIANECGFLTKGNVSRFIP